MNPFRSRGAAWLAMAAGGVLGLAAVSARGSVPSPCPGDSIVTTTADSGPGSLRQAILDANACPGTNRIEFAIPGPGLHTIVPVGGLPPVVDPLVIDGWSQPGFVRTPLLEINGSLSPSRFGLELRTSNSVVRGFAINRFAAPGGNGYAIGIFQGNGNWIYSCHLGTDASGTAPLGNGGGGVWIAPGSSANLIGSNSDGTADTAERNVISGNIGHGLLVQGSGNVIAGNHIGTDIHGFDPLGNQGEGVYLHGSASNLVGGNRQGARNVISANGRSLFQGGNGILIRFVAARDNVVAGNYIGLGSDGRRPLGNTTSGVALSSGASHNRIGTDGNGTADAAEGNVISGNANDGVTISLIGADAPVTDTIIAGNKIGTDLGGTVAIPNGDSGIYVIAGERNRIGTGTGGAGAAAERNLISGNPGAGVTLDGAAGVTALNTVSGNYIGTDLSGFAPLGNGLAGVRILNGASDNRVGGPNEAFGNLISYNGIGVAVESGFRNAIRSNRIVNNTALGIDLGEDGITPNDPGDPDGEFEANLLQNSPVLSPVNSGGLVTGQLSGPPLATFDIDLFLNRQCDASGAGEGEVFIGSTRLTTDSLGAGSFSLAYFQIPGLLFLTATATDEEGNSSEFSLCATGNTPPEALPQTVSGFEDTDLTVSLGGTDLDNDPLTARILSLPGSGTLHQFAGGGRGPAVTAPGTLVSDPGRRVIYAPPADANGAGLAGFNFSVNDGFEDSAAASITVNIAAVNDPPSFVPGPDIFVLEDQGALSIPGWASAISAGPPDESGQSVVFLVSTDNDPLFSTLPRIDPDGTLRFQTAPNATGDAVVMVLVRDDGLTGDGGIDIGFPETFHLQVFAVNDPPDFVAGPDQQIPEDAGPQLVLNWATGIHPGAANESSQTLEFRVDNDHPALFSVEPQVTPEGTLSYEAAPDAHGSATVTLRLRDNGGTAASGANSTEQRTFVITVIPVNDPPSFVPGPDVVVPEDAGLQQISGWAGAVSAGPPNEAGQLAVFELANDNPDLFLIQPSMDPDGTLRFQPAADAHGKAVVEVVLSDDGGSAGGGLDQFGPETFEIVVVPVNDCAAALGGSVATDEKTPVSIVLQGTDLEGDPLGFSIVQFPAHGFLSGLPPHLVYTPDPAHCGPDSFVFSVADGDPACVASQATVSLAVGCVNDCPVAIAAVVEPVHQKGTNHVVISPNNYTALVLFDGSLSTDPESDALGLAWFEAPPPPGVEQPLPPGMGKNESRKSLPSLDRCAGTVADLTVRYNGDDSAQVDVVQENGEILFSGPLLPGQDLHLVGTDQGTLGKRVAILVNGVDDGGFHTGCSQPIGPGVVSGSFIVVDGNSTEGGPLRQIAPLPLEEIVVFGGGLVAARELFLGTHSIGLVADDGICAVEDLILVTVITAGRAVEECIELVELSGAERKEKRALISALKKAMSEFDKGRFDKGLDKLEGFIRKVDKSVVEGKLDGVIGDGFNGCARDVIDAISI